MTSVNPPDLWGEDRTPPFHDESGRQSARLTPCLIRALDCSRPLAPEAAPARIALDQNEEILVGRSTDLGITQVPGSRERLAVTIPDPFMSSHHATLIRGDASIFRIEDAGSRNGTMLNGQRVRSAELADGDVIEMGSTFFVFRLAVPVSLDGENPLVPDASCVPPGIATLSAPLGAQFDQLTRIAGGRSAILIQGDSGTGKELIARAVHQLSERSGPLIAVNCGAIPKGLIASEFFGYRQGAFPDARENRLGLIRASHGGTLFLDEVGELPLEAQATFLRVLQESTVQPLGDTRTYPVDLRVVSATNRDMSRFVRFGGFREDLFGRLAGFQLRLPPLRERREDLGLIINHLIRRKFGNHAPRISFTREAARLLMLRPWALNVRELEQCISSAILLAAGDQVQSQHLAPPAPMSEAEALSPPAHGGTGTPLSMMHDDATLRAVLVNELRQHKGNVAAVARDLKKDRVQVYRLIERFAIDLKDFRER